MPFAIPDDDEGVIFSENVSIQPNSLGGGSLEVLGNIFTNYLSEYNPGFGLQIFNTQNVTGNTSASVVFYGGTRFQKELSLKSYLDIEGNISSTPDTNFTRIFFNTTGNVLQTVDFNGKTSTLNPLTTKGDLLSHNGTNETRLPVGTDTYILSADSAETTGLKWIVNTGGGGGEVNTASNVGVGGVGVFKQKTGTDFEFKNVNAGSNKITITDDTGNNEIDIDIDEANIVHQNLNGAGTNTHAQIDSHISSTSNPHSVTIDQVTPTTTKGDILVENGTNVIRLPIGTNGQVLLADSAEATGVKWGTESSNTTASNVGAGIGVFKQKLLDDLEFKSITSTTNRISVVDDTDEVDLTLNEANIVHQNLSGAGTNTHAQIDSHISSTSNPHSVTIDQVTPTTTKGDILVENGTNVVRVPIGTNGQVLLADSAEATGVKWGTESSNTTASNVGAGIGVFKQKLLGDLEFKSITSTTNRISVVDDTDEVDLTLNESNIEHGNLNGLGDDDHTQYLLLNGRAGGQIAIGGTQASDNLILQSTSNATKGNVQIIETTESNSTTTGALLVSGGVGIEKNAYIGNTLYSDSILEIANGVNLEGIIFDDTTFNMEQITAPSAPTGTTQTFYIDSNDSLFKSKDSSNNITIYQPTTSKGDLISHTDTIQTRLPIGSESQVLTVDPLQPTGIKWENVSSGTGGTGTDPNSNKYLNIYSSSTQTLTDSYQGLIFDTNRREDDIYFHSVTQQDEIQINTQGTFFIYFRCSTFVETGNKRASSSIRFVTDTGGGFNEIPGTKAFMFNRDNDEGYNTCCTSFIYEATPGDILQVQIKRDSGTSTIKTVQNASEFIIVRILVDQTNDITEYFSAYNSSSSNFGSTYSDVVFNSTRVVSNIYTYSTSTGIIELTENGIYTVLCNLSTQTNSNTETQCSFRLLADTGGGYTEIPGTRGYTHNDDDPDSTNTGFVSFIYNGTTGDKLKAQVKIDSGAGTASIITDGCNFNIMKLQSSLGQSTVQYFDGYTDNGSTTITTNYVDIPISSENIKDAIYTHAASSANITVTEDGRYIILARIAYTKSSGTTETAVKSRLLVDNGNGFFEIAGTESYSYHTNTTTGIQQTFIGATIQLAANSMIKMQGIILSGNNIKLSTYGTGITFIRLEELNVGQQGLVIFGTEVNYVASTNITSTNSLTYVQKLRLTTDNIPSGTYRIGFYYIWTIDNTKKDFSSRIQINDITDIHETTESIQRSNQDIATSGFIHISLALGIHTIDLDFKVASINTTASIKDARIEIWRLS